MMVVEDVFALAIPSPRLPAVGRHIRLALLDVRDLHHGLSLHHGRAQPFELLLVGTVLEGSIFLFEIPTGVVADVRSRRMSIIIGLILIGTGFAFEGAIPLFATVLIAQVIWGVGYTFISGAREAWIADELDDEEQTGRIYLRAPSWARPPRSLGC